MLFMAKGNYKVYADLGLSTQIKFCQFSVLNTGVAPNIIRNRLILIPTAHLGNIRAGLSWNIADAKNIPLRTAGNITLLGGLGTCLGSLSIIVCESIAAPVILGFDVCDRFVEAISPQKGSGTGKRLHHSDCSKAFSIRDAEASYAAGGAEVINQWPGVHEDVNRQFRADSVGNPSLDRS